jgi:hypothetical protein
MFSEREDNSVIFLDGIKKLLCSSRSAVFFFLIVTVNGQREAVEGKTGNFRPVDEACCIVGELLIDG